MTEEIEIWKDIEGYEGIYQVSQHGKVKSIGRFVKNYKDSIQWRPDRYLKAAFCGPKRDYLYVHLVNQNGQHKNHYIHRLIATYFIPNPNNLPQVNHKNGIKTDNRVENLEWCTCSHNIQHAAKMQLLPCGENNYNSRLTTKQVLSIRKNKKSLSKIADQYSVSPSLIWKIKALKTWKHV